MLKYWISDHAVQSMYAEPVYATKLEVKRRLDKYIKILMRKIIIIDGLYCIKRNR